MFCFVLSAGRPFTRASFDRSTMKKNKSGRLRIGKRMKIDSAVIATANAATAIGPAMRETLNPADSKELVRAMFCRGEMKRTKTAEGELRIAPTVPRRKVSKTIQRMDKLWRLMAKAIVDSIAMCASVKMISQRNSFFVLSAITPPSSVKISDGKKYADSASEMSNCAPPFSKI